MSPVEKEIVRRKIAVIIDNLNALKKIKGITLEEYDRDIHSIVLEAVSLAEDLYPRYIKEVDDYLSA